MLILIRGAGDIATGIALRLHRAGMQVVMTDLPHPTAIRRTVCFSPAIASPESLSRIRLYCSPMRSFLSCFFIFLPIRPDGSASFRA